MEGRDETQTSGCLYLGSHARRRLPSPLAYAPAKTSPGLSSLRSSPSLQYLLRFHEIVRVHREDVPLSPHLPLPVLYPICLVADSRVAPQSQCGLSSFPPHHSLPPPFSIPEDRSTHLVFRPQRCISLLEIPMYSPYRSFPPRIKPFLSTANAHGSPRPLSVSLPPSLPASLPPSLKSPQGSQPSPPPRWSR